MDWSPDRRLQGRMLLALALTLVGYAALLWIAFSTVPTAVALLICGALAVALIASVTRADLITYVATGAVAIDRDQYPLLYETTERLARQADLPRPPIAVIPADEANALSAGTGNRTVVCVTTGLLRSLSEDELEAVLAHELAHLKNEDSTVMTVAGFPMVVSAVALSTARRTFTPASFLLGIPLWIGLTLLFVGLPVYLASLPGTLVLSRYREYAADRGAVAITGKPFALASALATLHAESSAPETDLRSVAGFNAFRIVPTDSMSPFSTHPPTHRRIERLREQFTDR
ncbi:M48 family metalloprotease [Natrarchaeobius oligotrophus]|uniref:Peptidase M48 n=1 Tax=Natrarchaeobius chitinivorans TaxID=1679083 RepID=A0A3N6MD74_NATCH|nr:M48 family metalloprotease [Natrarchaeobius chitinivorans]RQH01884.1 peptidase M48 [Natrarchaeobius chitinivorans]